MQVSELMNTSVVTLSPADTVETAARLLARHNLGCLPVVSEKGSLKGILTDRDIVLRCVAPRDDAAHTKVSEVMSRRVMSVAPEDDVLKAAHLMASSQVRRLPVVSSGQVVGMLSLGDMAKEPGLSPMTSAALGGISANVRRAPSKTGE